MLNSPIYRPQDRWAPTVSGDRCGTYFRLPPLAVLVALMKKSAARGYVPMIYLHAADADDLTGPVRWTEIEPVSRTCRVASGVCQQQWLLGRTA